jgi:serine phosphatase RsbU (regulator of sigma subunit)/anti-sigma regulatory factor (Ser/Thr protein kinase)
MGGASISYQDLGLEDLPAVRRFIAESAADLGGDPEAVAELVVAAHEAVENILVHGYRRRPAALEVRVSLQGNDLEVCLADLAPPFDPTAAPPPAQGLPAESGPPGGVGIPMIGHFADQVRYRLTPAGRNELTLVKRNVRRPEQAALARQQELLHKLGFDRQAGERLSYPAGAIIYQEGDPAEAMFVLLSGEVLITVDGQVLDRLRPGSLFGEMALVENRPRGATAEAITDCRLLQVTAGQFAAQVSARPEFALQVMASMSRRLRRLMEEEVRLQRMEEEMRIAQQIQLRLLPERCPEVAGWECAAMYRSARHVGGDLYDFILLPDDPDHVHAVVADVTGKGVPAALFMALARTAIRAAIVSGRGLAEALEQTNRLVRHDAQAALFLSALLARVNVVSGRLTYASAGHEWPLWCRPASGEVLSLRAPGGVLGAFDFGHYQERQITLRPGEAVILFTDGVIEARNEGGELFGPERLEAVAAAGGWSSADELLGEIAQAVDDFTGRRQPADDQTLVVIRRAS